MARAAWALRASTGALCSSTARCAARRAACSSSKTLKSVAFAKVLEVIEPSGARVESDCPYFPRCGGCTYRHIRYEEELRLKKQRVQDNLVPHRRQ